MKASIVMGYDGLLTSDVVPDDTRVHLEIGDRLYITRLLDIAPDIQIQAGERGTIDYINMTTGFVEVLLDRFHKGLALYDNHMWLEPFGTEDIIGGVVCLRAVGAATQAA
jgi:hypothetical protein